VWRATRDALDDASALVARQGDPLGSDAGRKALADLAHEHRVRLRVLCPSGETCFDEDADDPVDPLHPIEAFFFSAVSEEEVRKVEEDAGPLAARPEVDFARQGGLYVDCQWERGLVCTGARRTEDTAHGGYILYVQKSSLRAVLAVYALRRHLMRLAIVTVPLAIVLALYAATRLMRPIEELRQQALEKAKDAGRTGALAEHEDEVGDLAAAFNSMLAALEAKRAENEAFVADLVHELKSPVAAVRATAESLAGGPPDPERAARFARILSDSAGKLDHLVTHFLELARAEAGMPNEERSRVDLAALARGIAARVGEDERHAKVTVTVEATPDAAGGEATVLGVPHRLDALVRELLENAASFAKASVAVRVSAEGDEAVLEVSDDGPGIAEADLPRVFARFFTTRGAGARGTGLGLALVRAVAEAHGGRVTARSAPGAGATFRLVLPRAR
jgi:two-component system sensor histidine kinase ChvG